MQPEPVGCGAVGPEEAIQSRPTLARELVVGPAGNATDDGLRWQRIGSKLGVVAVKLLMQEREEGSDHFAGLPICLPADGDQRVREACLAQEVEHGVGMAPSSHESARR